MITKTLYLLFVHMENDTNPKLLDVSEDYGWIDKEIVKFIQDEDPRWEDMQTDWQETERFGLENMKTVYMCYNGDWPSLLWVEERGPTEGGET